MEQVIYTLQFSLQAWEEYFQDKATLVFEFIELEFLNSMVKNIFTEMPSHSFKVLPRLKKFQLRSSSSIVSFSAIIMKAVRGMSIVELAIFPKYFNLYFFFFFTIVQRKQRTSKNKV